MKICFVCTGNTCRSPMAEVIMQEYLRKREIKDVEVCSAGLLAMAGSPASQHAQEVVKDLYGLDLGEHAATQFDQKILQESDLIITMTSQHKQLIETLFTENTGHVYILGEIISEGQLDIKDPFGGAYGEYAAVAKQLTAKIEIFPEDIWLKGSEDRQGKQEDGEA